MKLRMYYLEKELGTVELGKDGELIYGGPNEDCVRGVVEYYVQVTDLRGEALLHHVHRRLKSPTTTDEGALPTK
jgi:hypothetical protein